MGGDEREGGREGGRESCGGNTPRNATEASRLQSKQRSTDRTTQSFFQPLASTHTYHCLANCSGVSGRQTEMTTQKARESKPMRTAPGCLKRRDDHKEEPLAFRPFLREAIGTAAAGTLLGRAMASCLLRALSCVWCGMLCVS